jgi:hypothetical protein
MLDGMGMLGKRLGGEIVGQADRLAGPTAVKRRASVR